jgi:hypothetical protein
MSLRLGLRASSMVVLMSLVGCSQSESPEQGASSDASTPAPYVALQNAEVKTGMTEDEVKAILGDPKLIQTRTIDNLTITYSEWTDKSGRTSVQFQNGKVMFNQFFPASEE